MGSVETDRPKRGVTPLLMVTAALELGAGLTLLAAPAVVMRLLFGSAVAVFPAVGVARLAGAALMSLGAGCWWARDDERSAASRALVRALLVYNAVVVALVLLGGLGTLGLPQWAAVVLHTAMGVWCARLASRHG